MSGRVFRRVLIDRSLWDLSLILNEDLGGPRKAQPIYAVRRERS
jgi:hypothetical protein